MTAPAPELRRLPPRTRGVPLLGSVPGLLADPSGFLLRARATYGDCYTLDLGVARLVVVGSPQHARHLLVERVHAYRKAGPVWGLLRTVIGNGLATSEGAAWRRQRRMLQPAFHHARLEDLSAVMLPAIERNLAPWEDHARAGRPLDAVPACSRMALDVLMAALFGESTDERQLREMTKSVTFVLEFATLALLLHALPGWLPAPGRGRYRRSKQAIEEFVSEVIRRRRSSPGSSDLISLLLEQRHPADGSRLDDVELRDEAFTIFMAGYETTALTLAWSLHFLAANPVAQEMARAEVDTVVGSRPVAMSDVAQLGHVRRALQETLRLRPPAYWLPRTAATDDHIDGYRIRAGTGVALLILAVHHHPGHWERPERFDPDRFLPARSAGRHPYAWMPFGAGQRQCIGRDFALLESQLALATILQRYELRASPGPPPRMRLLSTLRPRGGIRILLRARRRVTAGARAGSRAPAAPGSVCAPARRRA